MASTNILELTADLFDSEVLQSDVPVLVDFWAEWCGPCRAIAPIVDALAEQYEGKVKFCKLNVDQEGALAAQYGVMSIPTLILFADGSQVQRMVGLQSRQQLDDAIKSSL